MSPKSDTVEHADRIWEYFVPVGLGILAVVFAALTILSVIGLPVDEFDDAIPLVHGALIQHGRVPNVDFYSFYPPLGLYVLAAAFSLFGKSIITARVIAGVFYLFVLFLIHRFYRLRFPSSERFAPMTTLLVAACIGQAIEMPSWPGLGLSLATLLSYMLAQNGTTNRFLAIAVSGMMAGFAILYRVNFGLYAVFVVMADLGLQWWLSGHARWERRQLTAFAKQAAAFTIPLVVVDTATCLLIYGRNTVPALMEFVVGAQKYMGQRRFINLHFTFFVVFAVTLPSIWFCLRLLLGEGRNRPRALWAAGFAAGNLALALILGPQPSIAVIGLAAEFGSVLVLHLFVKRLERWELNLLLYYCCLVHYYLTRADWPHWRYFPMGAAMLLPYLVFGSSAAVRREAGFAAGRKIVAAVLLAPVFLICLDPELRPHIRMALNGAHLMSLLARNPGESDASLVVGGRSSPAWWTVYGNGDELATLRYLRANSSSADPIFVGVADHSRLFWNNLRMYWLADHPIGARTFQLEPQVATEAPVQKTIIEDLERNKVKWVILDCRQFEGDETFMARHYQGSKLLDEYIASRFREERRFGQYAILSRKT